MSRLFGCEVMLQTHLLLLALKTKVCLTCVHECSAQALTLSRWWASPLLWSDALMSTQSMKTCWYHKHALRHQMMQNENRLTNASCWQLSSLNRDVAVFYVSSSVQAPSMYGGSYNADCNRECRIPTVYSVQWQCWFVQSKSCTANAKRANNEHENHCTLWQRLGVSNTDRQSKVKLKQMSRLSIVWNALTWQAMKCKTEWFCGLWKCFT